MNYSDYLDIVSNLSYFKKNSELLQEKLVTEPISIRSYIEEQNIINNLVKKFLLKKSKLVIPTTKLTEKQIYQYSLKFFSTILFDILGNNDKIEQYKFLFVKQELLRKEILFLIYDNIKTISARSIYKIISIYKESENKNLSEILHNFLLNNPVLFQLIVECGVYWVEYVSNLLLNIKKDFHILKEQFDIQILNIKKLLITGDKHNDRNVVSIVVFENNKKVVYKPRSLSIDKLFEKIIKIFNSKSNLKIKFPHTIDMGSYGWVEFIDHVGCKNKKELNNFYYRIGLLQSLLYVLNGHDIHYDNLIANGEYPIIVDAECFFDTHFSIEQLNNPLFNSVLKSFLLPSKLSINNQSLWLGGVNDIKNQKALIETEYFSEKGVYQKERLKYDISKNIPFIDSTDTQTSFIDFIDFIKKGFSFGYDIIQTIQEDIIKIIDESDNVLLRHLARPTYTYTYLRQESFDPDFLGSFIERDIFFDWLWYNTENNIPFNKIIKHEKNILKVDCIPQFNYKIKEKSLYLSNGEVIIDNYFSISGYDLFKKKIYSLSKNDKLNQISIIDLSLSLYKGETIKKTIILSELDNFNNDYDKFAKNIFNFIFKQFSYKKLRDSEEYIDILETEYGNQIDTVDIDLYDGLSGYLMFFIYYNYIYPNFESEKIIKHINKLIVKKIFKEKIGYNIGAYKGISGVIYVFCNQYYLYKNNDIKTIINDLLDLLHIKLNNKQEQQSLNFDIVNGLSGCIIAVKSAILVNKDKVVKIINLCCKILINNIIKTPKGIGWKKFTDIPAVGFAHGNSGVAFAFAIAYKITKNKIYKNLSDSAVDYENNYFDKKIGNWCDPSKDNNYSYYWCNGASGIGMCRLELMNIFNINKYNEEIEYAINTTKKNGFGSNECLCHGNFGNFDFLFKYAEYTKDEKLQNLLQNQLIPKLVDNISKNGLKFSSYHTVVTNSLMTGLIGLGYQLLRIRKPIIVPSILTLDFPLINYT